MNTMQFWPEVLLAVAATAQAPESPAPRVPPQPTVAIGAKIDAKFTDLHWQSRHLADLRPRPATVIYFATVGCPMVGRTLPRLGEIARDYAGRNVVTIVMNASAGDAFVEAAAQGTEHAPAAIFGKDDDLSCAHACGIERTNTVVVLDREGKLRYRGMIDDQHHYAASRDQPSRAHLRQALDELLGGQAVTVPETTIHGCRLTPRPPLDAQHVPTYLRDTAPLFFRVCGRCHGNDAPGAVPLAAEADVKKHSAMIAEVVGNGRMPPWFAADTPVPFVNRRALTLTQRETIRAWVEGGMPRGERYEFTRHPMNLPWRVGDVRLVLDAPDVVNVPAAGSLPYQYIVLPHTFAKETWVEAVDIRSQEPRALHHCNLAVVPAGSQYEPRAWLSNYTPHGAPFACVPGTALRIPAGAVLALQAYYVPVGRALADRLQVGLRFPGRPVQQEVHVSTFGADMLEIPAGAWSHPVGASMTVPADGVGISLFVHMHLRGRDATVAAENPDGSRRPLLVVPNYSFGGQETYLWPHNAVPLAKGTKIHAVAHFDNSTWNEANPDSRQVVRAGPGIGDEQFQVSLTWLSRDTLGIAVDPATGELAATAPK